MLTETITVTGGRPAELLVPLGVIWQFALMLCRTAGLFTFLSIPGLKSGLDPQRLMLAVLLAILMIPWTNAQGSALPALSDMARIAGGEAVLGIGLGLCVALMQEGIQLAAQMAGLQAGFSYASTIDPSSNADSAILQVVLSLGSSLMFLAMGLDTVLFRFLLAGIETAPPGQWTFSPQHLSGVMMLFPPLFIDGIRFSLPVVATLLVIDTALSLLSRLQPQLQLLTLSFPLKMLAAMVFIAYGSPLLPRAVERASHRSFEVIQFLLAAPAGAR